jgi:hypothetical protein
MRYDRMMRVTGMTSSDANDVTAGEAARRRVHVVPHTHWERE